MINITKEEYLVAEITRLVNMLEQDNLELHKLEEFGHDKYVIDSMISQNLVVLLNLDRILLDYANLEVC